MSAGPRPGTVLEQLAGEFHRVTGLTNLFHLTPWLCEQMRALKASMGSRFPVTREGQERALLAVIKAKPGASSK